MERNEAKVLHTKFIDMVKKFAEENNLVYHNKSNCKFNDFDIEFKTTLNKPGGEKANFERDCEIFGLKPEHYNNTFTSQGQTFKIVGISARKRKYPIIAEELKTAKRYKFSPAIVLFCLK